MVLSAIIERELRVSARNWRTYYSRVGVGIWAVALCFYLIWLVQAALGGGPAGATVLGAASMMSLALCLFTGASRTCDTISGEKREDTLGLLFLTHLKPGDILFGKMLAEGVRTAYLLLAVQPILAIPIFLGGVSATALFRIPFVLLNSLFLSLSLGLFISTLAWTQRTAHGWTGLSVCTLGFFLPGAAYLLQLYALAPSLVPALNLPSPTYALLMSQGSAIGLSTNYFWAALGVQFLMAAGLMSAACLLLPHCWRVRAGKGWRFRAWVTNLAHGTGATRTARRSRMLAKNAIYWLNSRDRFAPLGPIIFGVVTLAIAAGCIVYFEVSSEQAFAIFFAALAINDFSFRIRVASLASMRLGMDRQSGALELLLSTPTSVREIVQGIWKSIRHALIWSYVAVLLLYLAAVGLFLGRDADAQWLVAGFFVICSICDLIAMGYVAMWNAMRMRNAQQATGYALLRVLLLPWTIWAGAMPLIVQFSVEFGGTVGLILAVVLWGISTGTAIRTARRNLFAHFREAATDRYRFEEERSIITRARRCCDDFLTSFLLRRERSCVLD